MILYVVLSRDPYFPNKPYIVMEAMFTDMEDAERWRLKQTKPWDYMIEQRNITPRWTRHYPYIAIP